MPVRCVAQSDLQGFRRGNFIPSGSLQSSSSPAECSLPPDLDYLFDPECLVTTSVICFQLSWAFGAVRVSLMRHFL